MRTKMNTYNTNVAASLLLAFALCLGMLPGIGVTGVRAQGGASDNPKLSADLDHLFNQNPSSNEMIQIIVETPSAPTKSLMTELTSSGGLAPVKYTNMTMVYGSTQLYKMDELAARSDVLYISLNRQAKRTGHISLTTGADAARASGGATPYNGTGIGIAVLDSGMMTNHLSFQDPANASTRVKASVDFTGQNRVDDPYGHGTHVAAIAAANEMVSGGAYRGIAARANIINLRVLNSQGTGSLSSLLSAIDWIISNRTTHNIRVVNMSLGTEAVDSYRNDPLCRAARKLVDLNIVVVAAAGNQGKDSSGQKIYGLIHSPGIEPSVITVGAVNTFGTDSRIDDTIATYSSRGPTRGRYTDASGVVHHDNLIKPDLVAPGNKIIDAQAANNYLVSQNPTLDANVSGAATKEQMYLSGTSMATPAVSGAAALMLQANPKLTPNLVKMLLQYTAQQIPNFNQLEQGAGLLNVEGAVKLAKLVRTDLTPETPLGDPLLVGAAPAPQSTIGYETFTWGQGLMMGSTFATGIDLITKYQKIYGLGVLVSDGVMVSDGVLVSDGVMVSDGVLVSDNILTNNGVMVSDGTPFLSCGVLVSDGVMVSDGVFLGDGVLVSDGVMVSDGVLVADVKALANRVLVEGDAGLSMAVEVDTTIDLPAAPTSLVVSAVSMTQLNLSWKDMSSDEGGFLVERCMGSTCTNFAQVAQVGANATTFSSTGLVKGTVYRFRVRAFNAAGNSSYTSIVNGTTKTR